MVIGLGILAIALILMVAFSPYGSHPGFEHRVVKVSVTINAHPAQVFNYLGNSQNARQWSSFVHHITPLNSNEKADGELGAKRRCYKYEDESGEQWDEEILAVEENKYRQLSCYNIQNFPLSAENLRTEQLYSELNNGSTELSFSLYFARDQASFLDELKMYFAGFVVEGIFEENLNNIKQLVENGG